MRIDWTYDGCDEHDVPVIEQYWQQIQIQLEGKLAELSDVPSELRIAVEQRESNPTWGIEAALHLPGHTLVATGDAQQPEHALDEVLRGLAQQIDALEEVSVRATQRREGVPGIVKLLQRWRTQNRSQAFLSFLVPLLKAVGPYVRHELSVRENEGTLIGEEIDTSDVLDEVLVQAWERFEQRGDSLPFDLWLVQLADEVLDRLSVQVADSSIDEPAPGSPMDGISEEREAWIEQVSYPETIDIAEILPDGPGVETWDDLDLETKQTHLSEMLGKLDRDQRQAFVLNLVHGFEVAEIADFQSRAVAQVELDVAQAIATIQRWFTDEQTPEQEESFARAEMRGRRRRRG